jgi:hypothetical protein
MILTAHNELPQFSERSFKSIDQITCIGSGEIGGKAKGLVFINEILKAKFHLWLFYPQMFLIYLLNETICMG